MTQAISLGSTYRTLLLFHEICSFSWPKKGSLGCALPSSGG